jgi:hypothetical protein
MAARAQMLNQETHLRALARAIDAFERDKDAGALQVFSLTCA